MKFEDFKSGTYKKQYKYSSFMPCKVNSQWCWDNVRINTLLEDAVQAISQLDAFANIVPNIDLYIKMHIALEANQSSRIEGTQTSIDEALMDEEYIIPEKRDDWKEVNNYVKAMNMAIGELSTLPLSMRLLKKTHEILLSGVRGEHKLPGEIRKSQNWIGGTGLADAVFIPPHHDDLPELLTDMEKFWHNDEIFVPHLIKAAISHYQFETVHPFLDGNGRIGRLMITLYLLECGMLKKPVLYLSDYFEKHKGAYYDALTTVRSSNDITHWVSFFLIAIIETAKKGQNTFKKILELKTELDGWVVTLGRRAESAQRLVNMLYERPVVNAATIANVLDMTPKTVFSLIEEFEKNGTLRELTGYKRNRMYAFVKYLELF